MNILFVMRSTVYVRNFESVLRLLAQRGHRVHVVARAHHLLDPTDLIGRLCREYAGITHGLPPEGASNRWTTLGEDLRCGIDYLRYLGPEYRDAPKLRQRAERTAPAFLRSPAAARLTAWSAGRWSASRILRWCDRALPRDPAVDGFVRQHRPDLLLVTPLVEPGCPQIEFLRSARALGIRTGLCVYSWDNLTNKGLIQDPLDVVTVWNDAMKEEAVRFHKVPAKRIVVTGAVPYDHWFAWKPSTPREAFCATVALRADRPYLLYLCSSKFVAPEEAAFVRRWVEQLRAKSTVLGAVGVLVRPHPQNVDQWRGVDLSDLGQVALWPPAGRNPVDEDSRAEYYDSMYHSAAVVGVNTSAQIESAIIGRPVYTWLAPEYRDTQGGTLHFQHLRVDDGGLLYVAETFPEHVAQLEAAIGGVSDDGRRRRFVERFVRPLGVDVPAAPKLVDALESLGSRPAPRPERVPWRAPLVRRVLAGPARQREEPPESPREKQRQATAAERAAEKVAREAERQRAKDRRIEQTRRHQREKQQKTAARAAKKSGGQAGADAASAFANYQCARERVRRMKEIEAERHPRPVALTPAEGRMLSRLGHMWNATPETIASLRRYCEPITGVCAADYQNVPSDASRPFWRDLRRLRKDGTNAFLLPELPRLGGFGHDGRNRRDGVFGLYNEDTLKFYEAIAALRQGALLDAFREADRRSVVWEIGGGWGGFAYQFKTLCPAVTYIITGFPELLLFSAVYLMTVFPDARCRFYGESPAHEFWCDLDSIDFVFVPESALDQMCPPRVDLTVDLLALERMTEERVRLHVQRAFDLRSQYLYSLCPADDSLSDGLAPVRRAVEKLYWPHVVPVPGSERMEVITGSRARVPGVPEGVKHCHLMGWRRLRV